MKQFFQPRLLPWLTLGMGGIGFALRSWLFSLADEQGLLPAAHPARILLYILSGVFLVALWLCAGKLQPIGKYARLFPPSLSGAIGCALGAVGILIGAVLELSARHGILSILSALLGLVAACSLGYLGLCRYHGRRPPYCFHGLVTLYFMLHTVCQCRVWGSEPQLDLYAFPLLACLCLMFAAYDHTVLTTRKGSRRLLVLLTQAGAYLCLLCLCGEHRLFYLFTGAWLVLDHCSLQQKRPQAGEELC